MRLTGKRADVDLPASRGRHPVWELSVVVVVAMLAVLITAVAHPLLAHRPPPSLIASPRLSSAGPPPAGPPPAGRPTAGQSGVVAETQTVSVDGVRRTYHSTVPVQMTGRLPLLIVLHGRGQSGSVAERDTGFLGLVEQGRAILVAPDGEQRSWNAGHGCCGVAGSRRTQDVPFVAAIVADAVRRWPVDAGRVYLVGYSNGGKLAYSEGCAHPTLFAAVATYGAVPLSPCTPGTPAVPFLLAAGSADSVLPFHGYPSGSPSLPSVPQALGWLRSQDGCPAREQTAQDGSAVVQRWVGCARGTEVESVVYARHGHAWPAAGTSGGSPAVDTLMWVFLNRHDVRTVALPRPS
ncbi:MAG: PHB depolymerase family esterase [Pseudonocardiaceae bacterium]